MEASNKAKKLLGSFKKTGEALGKAGDCDKGHQGTEKSSGKTW